jgi:hypothetical protein
MAEHIMYLSLHIHVFCYTPGEGYTEKELNIITDWTEGEAITKTHVLLLYKLKIAAWSLYSSFCYWRYMKLNSRAVKIK